jgi:hypothetical protein
MISRVKCLIMSSHGACCATCGGTTYPDPDRTLVFDLTLDGELPNGEILYMSYVFAFHLARDRAVAKVESLNICRNPNIRSKLVPVILFVCPFVCFRSI